MKIKSILMMFIIVLTAFIIAGCNTSNNTVKETSSTTTNSNASTTTSAATTTTTVTTQPVVTQQLVIHYKRVNNDYTGWNFWIWKTQPTSGSGAAYSFNDEDEYGKITRINLTGDLKNATSVGIIPRLNNWDAKDMDQDRLIDLTKITNGELHIWLVQGDATIYYSIENVGTPKEDPLKNLDLNFTNTNHTGVYYEIFVRSFADSNGDGVGDFRGIANNLPYLSDLGIEGIWLMPMLESSSYHGYDVTNYYSVERDYGTMADFEHLLNEADKLGIKVIIDLVINHTSAQHPWFVSSRGSKTSVYRDWFVWIDSSNPLRQRNGAWGQNIWHYASGQYYAGYFWDQMPDLNMQNEAVQEELKSIGKYWLDKGVDGFRLDAAMHMYGKNEYPDHVDYQSENILWWHDFRTTLQETHPDVYLVGEVWDSPNVISPYFKGLHSAFNFDFSHKILNVVKSNSGYGYTSGLESVYNLYNQSNPNYLDATFLTNHDEDRIASQVNNLDDLKMAADLLFMLSGNPYIYYGEELGMKGYKSNGPIYDETRRLPFIWSKTDNPNNTTWIKSNINDGVASVEQQLLDPNSLLNHYKTLIDIRTNNIALEEGDFIPYTIKSNLISYLKTTDSQTLLVIHNPSTSDSSLNLINDDFSRIVYNSNLSTTSLIKSNSTLVLEINTNKVTDYLNK